MRPCSTRPLAVALAAALTIAASGCGGGGHSGKWRVILYGDSLSVEAGPYIAKSLRKSGQVKFMSRAVSGTAPCDWAKEIRHDVARKQVDLAIVEVYGNNASTCQLVNGRRARTDSSAYWAEYRRELKASLDLFPQSTKVMLVTAPASSVDRVTGHSHKAHMLAMMETLADHRGNTVAVDAGSRVEQPAGFFARTMRCAKGGPCPNHPRPGFAIVRAHDGLHFCPPMMFAKTDLLKHCPVLAYGAWRFGIYIAVKAARMMGIKAYPPPLKLV